MFIRVVFPHPDGPQIHVKDPLLIVKEISSRILLSPKDLQTLFICMIPAPPLIAADPDMVIPHEFVIYSFTARNPQLSLGRFSLTAFKGFLSLFKDGLQRFSF